MPQITLADGRSLGFEDPQQGKPIFFFHGQPGNRLFRLPTSPEYRLITLDRPGYGLSDFQPGRLLLDWPADVLAVADALGLERFGVIGYSAGGPYAAACAYALPLQRLTSVALVASAGPVRLPGVRLPALLRVNQWFRKSPRLWKASFEWFWRISRRNPQAFINAAFRQGHASDRMLESQLRPIFQRSWDENIRIDCEGYRYEAGLLLDDWGFALDAIRASVHVWHGTADMNAPIAWGQYLAGTIPNASFHEIPEQGHFAVLFNQWAEILAQAYRPASS